MADLRGKQIRESYRFLIGLSARTTAASVFGIGMETTPRFITDGDGNRSALRLGTNTVSIDGSAIVSGNVTVQSTLTVSGNAVLLGTTNIATLSAGGTIIASTFNATSLSNGGFQGIATDSATQPSFTWTGDLDTGMYRPTTNTLGFTTAGVERMRISDNRLQFSGTFPVIKLVDINAPITHNQTDIYRSDGQAGIRTINSSAQLVSNDYFYNIGASGATDHNWRIAQIPAALINDTGTAANSPITLMTRQKCDARYAQLSADQNIFTGNIIATSAMQLRNNSLVQYNALLSSTDVGFLDFNIISETVTTAVTRFNRTTSAASTSIIFHTGNGSTDIEARIDSGTGNSLPDPKQIVTREKGDARYAQLNNTVDFTSVRLGNTTNPHLLFDGVQNSVRGVAISVSGTFAAMVHPVGTAAPSTTTVITREKGDARYAQLSALNTFSSNQLIGRTVATLGNQGIALFANGTAYFERSGNTSVVVNRITNDGVLISLTRDAVLQGSISVAGTTVSYNSFAGSHWGQLTDNSKPNIFRGTVMETIDEMCEWENEENDQLPKVKISDTPASSSVYGVFMGWDNDDLINNDMYVVGVGAHLVRISGTVSVKRGDLLESNGDGTARVQSDNIIKSSTIGKVTANIVIETFPDDSYLVPAVLYCG